MKQVALPYRSRTFVHLKTVLVGGCLALAASAAMGWEFAPFEADYEVRYGRVPFAVKGVRRLEMTEDRWIFETRLDAGLLRLEQRSVLTPQTLQPRRYHYLLRGLAGSRDRILLFDREAGLVLRRGDKVRQQPLEAGAWDPLSWQLALRRDMAQGPTQPDREISYRVTDGGEYKEYRFRIVGDDTISVPAGRFSTVRAERLVAGDEEQRRTIVWLAPGLDWLMVRLELADDDGATLKLELRSVSNGGRAS